MVASEPKGKSVILWCDAIVLVSLPGGAYPIVPVPAAKFATLPSIEEERDEVALEEDVR